jgi:hypothetical protein
MPKEIFVKFVGGAWYMLWLRRNIKTFPVSFAERFSAQTHFVKMITTFVTIVIKATQ